MSGKVVRFAALDGWRGIAAVAVAVYHLPVNWHFYWSSLIRDSYLFVDFFFVLSGFVIANSYLQALQTPQDVKIFLIRRFGRLYPLHLAVLLAMVCFEFVKFALINLGSSAETTPFTGPFSIASLISNLLLLQSMGLHDVLTWNSPSWSISVEFYVYITFSLFAVATTDRARLKVCIAIIVIASLLLMALSNKGIGVTFDLGFLRGIYGFFVGVATYRIYRSAQIGDRRKLAVLEAAALALTLIFVCVAGTGSLTYLAPLVFSVVVYVFAHQGGPISIVLSSPPLRFLGDCSYSIYMVHYFIMKNIVARPVMTLQKTLGVEWTVYIPADANNGALDESVNLILLNGQIACDVLLVAYLVTVLTAAAVTYRYIEVPARDFFNRLAASMRRSKGGKLAKLSS